MESSQFLQDSLEIELSQLEIPVCWSNDCLCPYLDFAEEEGLISKLNQGGVLLFYEHLFLVCPTTKCQQIQQTWLMVSDNL